MNRIINKIILHCTDTRIDKKISTADIEIWHTSPKLDRNGVWIYKGKEYKNKEDMPDEYMFGKHIKEYNGTGRGWKTSGYHILVHQDGLCNYLNDFSLITPGCIGHNKHSIHIAFVGGRESDNKPADTLTEKQIESGKMLILQIKSLYKDAKVFGHCELDYKKSCPNFAVKKYFLQL